MPFLLLYLYGVLRDATNSNIEYSYLRQELRFVPRD